MWGGTQCQMKAAALHAILPYWFCPLPSHIAPPVCMYSLLWSPLYHRLSEKWYDLCSCLLHFLTARNLLRLGDLVVDYKNGGFFLLSSTFLTFVCLGLYWVMNYISCGFPICLNPITAIKGLVEWIYRTGMLSGICSLFKGWGPRRVLCFFVCFVISQHLPLPQSFSAFGR